jgi:transposase
VIDSHKQEDIIKTLRQQPIELRGRVEEVSMDLWGEFSKVVQEVFPNAQLVFNRFHVMKPVNKELNKIRKTEITVQGSRFLLLKNRIDLNSDDLIKLDKILNPSKRLRTDHELKEEFREIFESDIRLQRGRRNSSSGLEMLEQFIVMFCQLFAIIIDGICNYFLSRTTSGVMEGINNKLKLIK